MAGPKAKDLKALETALAHAQEKRDSFEDVFAVFASQLGMDQLRYALAAWQEAITQVKDCAQTVFEDARAYYDERSERWQNSDKGSNYETWCEALEELTELETEPDAAFRLAITLTSSEISADWEDDPTDCLGEPPELPELET